VIQDGAHGRRHLEHVAHNEEMHELAYVSDWGLKLWGETAGVEEAEHLLESGLLCMRDGREKNPSVFPSRIAVTEEGLQRKQGCLGSKV
jgi:hypothetical protein